MCGTHTILVKFGFYSNIAINMLLDYGHQVTAVGNKIGEIRKVKIESDMPIDIKFDAITLYLNPKNQEPYYQDILALNPKRVIFNPVTENPIFMGFLRDGRVVIGLTTY